MKYVPTAKKDLGQHWLHDKPSLEAIAAAAAVKAGDEVLEIGPGLGTLTEVLLERGAIVTAVEYDSYLADELPYQLTSSNLRVVHQDIMKFNLTALSENYKIVSNIPYYLTSHLLRVLCESTNPFSVASLLVQKEVAERICAAPGQMSLLSMSVQYYCKVELGKLIPAKLFTPPPKVDSQIVVLHYRSKPLFKGVNDAKFFRLVKAGFSSRRKKLRSSLSAGLRLEKAETEALLTKAGLDPGLRAQALSLDDWHQLYLAYEKH